MISGSGPSPFFGRFTVWKPAGTNATESPTFTFSLEGKNALAVVVSPSFLAVARGGPTYIVFGLRLRGCRHEQNATAALATAAVRNETISGAPLRCVGHIQQAACEPCQVAGEMCVGVRGPRYGYLSSTGTGNLHIRRGNSLAATDRYRDSRPMRRTLLPSLLSRPSRGARPRRRDGPRRRSAGRADLQRRRSRSRTSTCSRATRSPGTTTRCAPTTSTPTTAASPRRAC